MPRRPPNLVTHSAPVLIKDRSRPWLRWYGTQAWRRRAQRQLEEEPLCRLCLAQGRVEAAKVADHVRDHKGDHRAFWEGELQSLCIYHHNSKTRLDDAARKGTGKPRLMRGCTVTGEPIDARHPWNRP